MMVFKADNNVPLQMNDHVVQNRQTGQHKTHYDMLNKENPNLVAFPFNMSQWVICSPVWRFVPRDRSAAKGPLHGIDSAVL